MSKIKVLFILPSLRAGGAERVISFIAQNIDKKTFDPILIVVGFEKDKSYSIENLKVVYLNKTRVIKGVPSLFYLLRQYKPNIVVSSIGHVNILLGVFSLVFPNMRFIAREASVNGKRKRSKSIKNQIYERLVKLFYPRLDKIICQSIDMKEDLLENYDISSEKVIVINNPITNSQKSPRAKTKINYDKTINYITIGRLVDVKGHSRILEALSKISFAFTYTIIGEGPLKSEIFDIIKNYNMVEKVKYVAFTNNVNEYLLASDFFLQGSYIEGFPNATLESCTVGTPVIAFDAPGGTKEIIKNGINGFIVKSEEEFLDKLRERYDWDASQIISSVHEKFGAETIINQYTNLFLKI